MLIHVEIELNNAITVKRLEIPDNIRYTVELNQYIRNYFTELGYNVGNYLSV